MLTNFRNCALIFSLSLSLSAIAGPPTPDQEGTYVGTFRGSSTVYSAGSLGKENESITLTIMNDGHCFINEVHDTVGSYGPRTIGFAGNTAEGFTAGTAVIKGSGEKTKLKGTLSILTATGYKTGKISLKKISL